MKHEEYALQKQVCAYISSQYPSVIFISTGMSIRLTEAQSRRNKAIQKDGFKCPDLLILEPRGQWHGLFIELKTESPFRKDGVIKKSQNDHLEKQDDALIALRAKNYFAYFSWSFDQTKLIIDNYLGNKL